MILVDNKPEIVFNHCKFSDDGGLNILQNLPNWKTTDHPTIWTNIVYFTKVSINMSAQYMYKKFPPLDDETLPHFVKGIAVGIIQESAAISYYKGMHFMTVNLTLDVHYLRSMDTFIHIDNNLLCNSGTNRTEQVLKL